METLELFFHPINEYMSPSNLCLLGKYDNKHRYLDFAIHKNCASINILLKYFIYYESALANIRNKILERKLSGSL